MVPKCHGEDAERAADDSESAAAGSNRAADDSESLGQSPERPAIDASSSADDSRRSFFSYEPTTDLSDIDIAHRATTIPYRQ